MGRLCLSLILLFLVSSVSCLHFQRVPAKHMTAQSQLQALRAQQLSFENQVNSLISNITDLDSKVKAASNISDKVDLLENAIISERETIFELSNSLIPPFNLSKNACKELTNEQKINLLDQVNAAKKEIATIQSLAASIPPCAEIKLINSDLKKQSTLIDSIEKAIFTKCNSSIILSATIFQSNIYATNWILGNQTIDDLIQEYYQRSIQYDNITNCPLEMPFFDSNQCIQCQDDLPIFNMFTRQCDICPFDTQLNAGLRTCEQIQHYSDFSKTNNYNLDGASSLPTPDSKLTPCPAKTPFWNGQCTSCKSGKWWSVKDNICKSCPVGQAFDVNLRSCVTPSGTPFLTVLQGTQWVTSSGNFTQVLKERADLLNSNTTKIQYCSDDSPYFDGFQCVKCDKQFDLKSQKCTAAPANNVYDDNIHAFVPADTNKQTNANATKVLAPKPLTNNPSVPDCDNSTPYFDGTACISCPQPFILFDTASKKCVACEGAQIYNKATLKCQKRPSVYISTNFNKLMATQKQSIDSYKQELLDKVKNNKDSIVNKCNDSNQYSNLTNCFACGSSEYFNVETKTCSICNGTMNTTTSFCIPKNTLITNLTTAPNLLLSGKNTINDYTKEQSQILGPIEVCPTSKPYAASGILCISCESPAIYFDLALKKCTDCPANFFYNSKLLTCEQGQVVTNVNALTNFIEVENYTIINLKKQVTEIAKTKPIIQCAPATPFYDGSKCISCPNGTYLNLKTHACDPPVPVANVEALKALKNVFEQDNYTISAIAASIKNITVPTVACDAAKPAYNGKTCYSCPQNQFYKLKTNQCVTSINSSNIEQLKKLKNIKKTDNFTVDDYEKQIKSAELPLAPCNETTPLFDGKTCIGCDDYSQYDLKNLVCIPPQMYTNTAALKTSKYIQLGNGTISNIDAANAKIPLPKKPCPPESPLYNSTACIACANGSFYNLQTLNCLNAIVVTNVEAIKKSNNYLEVDNFTLANISQQNSKNTLPTAPCDPLKPLFDGKSCLGCPNNSLYNLKLNTCVNCSTQNYYDNKTHSCLPKPHYYPSSANNNWVVEDPAGIDRLINFTIDRKKLSDPIPCPSGNEFFNNKTLDCQSCPTGQYFNYDSFACVSCPTGQEVDPNTHVCSAKAQPGSFQTTLNSSNLIYNGISSSQLQEKYDTSKVKYSSIKDCPADKPFFDGYACITCHPSIQYFNLDTQRCQNCGTDGAIYSLELHDCVKQREVINTSPNPAKMYSSIF